MTRLTAVISTCLQRGVLPLILVLFFNVLSGEARAQEFYPADFGGGDLETTGWEVQNAWGDFTLGWDPTTFWGAPPVGMVTKVRFRVSNLGASQPREARLYEDNSATNLLYSSGFETSYIYDPVLLIYEAILTDPFPVSAGTQMLACHLDFPVLGTNILPSGNILWAFGAGVPGSGGVDNSTPAFQFYVSPLNSIGDDVQLWLKADTGVVDVVGDIPASGTPLRTWEDQDLNPQNVVDIEQFFSPIYDSDPEDLVNFLPKVNLQNGDRDLQSNADVEALDVFAVHRPRDFAFTPLSGLFGYDSGIGLRMDGTSYLTNSAQDFAFGGGFNSVNGGTSVNHNQELHVVHSRSVTPRNGQIFVGGFVTATGEGYTGDYCEIIVLNAERTPAQVSIIESYLALKWGVSLDQTTPQDYVDGEGNVIWSAAANANFNQNIFGVGRDTSWDLFKRQAQSSNPGSLLAMGVGSVEESNDANTSLIRTDKSFCVLSDNGEGGISPLGFAGPAGLSAPFFLNRIWRVSEIGVPNDLLNIGNVELRFDRSMLPFTANDASQYRLVVENSTNFTAASTLLSPSAFTDDYVSFVVDLSDGQFFTLVGAGMAPGGQRDNLQVWLKSDRGVTLNGTGVSQWNGFGDRAVEANARSTAGTPTFVDATQGINFNPVVSLDGVDDGFDITNGIFGNETVEDLHFFAITRPRTAQASAFFNENITGGLYQQFIPWSDQNIYFNAGNTTDGDGSLIVNWGAEYQEPHLWSMANLRTGGQSKTIRRDGLQIANSNTALVLTGTNSDATLGSWGPGNFDAADYAEVITYFGELTDTEKNQVESYLAIKYGLTLDQSTPTSYRDSDGAIIWNAATAGGYDNDIAGIGRDDFSDLNQRRSRSVLDSADVTISANTTVSPQDVPFTDKNFLIWANNGDDFTLTTEKYPPTNCLTKTSRTWKVSEVGEVGLVTVQFDLKAMKLDGFPIGSFRLIQRPNNDDFTDGALGTQTVAFSLNSDVLTFVGIDFANDEYFTLEVNAGNSGTVVNGLQVWMKADEGTNTAVDGASVTTWQSQEINARNTNGSNNPIFRNSGEGLLNFNPSIEFNGNNYFNTVDNSIIGSDNGYTKIAVVQRQTNTNRGDILSSGSAAGDHTFFFESTDLPRLSHSGNFTISTIASDTDQSALLAGRYGGDERTNILNVNGAEGVSNNTTADFNDNGPIAIGKYQGAASAANSGLDGFIAEAMVYNRALSDAEIQRVESYLAIKYGIGMSKNYISSRNQPIWDITEAGGAFNQQIFGIGADACSRLNQKQSKSNQSDFLTIGLQEIAATNALNTNNFPATNRYLMLGANASPLEFQTTDIPAEVNTRLQKEWLVQERLGGSGLQDIQIDFSDVPFKAVLAGNIYLLLDDDGDGNFANATPIAATTLNTTTKIATWDNIDLDNLDRITFGEFGPTPGAISANIELWFRSDLGVTGTTNASSWENSARNIAVPTIDQANVASQPSILEDGINYNKALDFDGGDWLTRSTVLLSNVNSGNKISAYIILQNDLGGVASSFQGVSNNKISLEGANGVYDSNGGNLVGFGNSDRPRILSLVANATQLSGYTNGGAQVVQNYTNLDATSTGFVTVGALRNGQFAYNGKIMETVWYDATHSEAERIKVETYLAIKSGITLDHNYVATDDQIVWDVAADATYSNNLLSIARDDAEGLLQKQSKSANSNDLYIGLTSIAATNDANATVIANDLQYLVVGDNDAAGKINFPQPIPSLTCLQAWAKVWKATETGALPNTQLSFDLDAMPFDLSASTDYYLIISQNENFTGALTNTNAGTIAAGRLVFNNINLEDGQYFTIVKEGVAPGNDATDLQLWIKANEGITDPGVSVTAVRDQSGQSRDGQGFVGDTDLISDAINGNEALEFDGNDYFSVPLDLNPSAFNEQEIFIIYETDANSNEGLLGNDNGGFDTYITNQQITGQGNNYTGHAAAANVANRTKLLNVSFDHDVANGSGTWVNGVANPSFTWGGAEGGTDLLAIGTINISNPLFFALNGRIGEIIVYGENKTQAEREQIASYLGIKYGLTLDHNYSDGAGTTIFNLNTNYPNNILAIGQDDCSDLNQRNSRSEEVGSIITIGNPSAMANEEFYFASNDGAALTMSNDVPAGFPADFCAQRIERIWRTAVVGDVGTVDVSFDLNAIPVASYAASDYRLLVSATGANNMAAATVLPIVPTINAQNEITFTGVALAGGVTFSLALNAQAPGRVVEDLNLWLRSDPAFQFGAEDLAGGSVNSDNATVRSWNSKVGNNHIDINSNSIFTYQSQPNELVNGYGYLQNNNSNRQAASQNQIAARTMAVVVRVNTPQQNLDGLMGMDGDRGLRLQGGNPNYSGNSNAGDWAQDGGADYVNGRATSAFPDDEWHIIFTDRNSSINNTFFVGGYTAGRAINAGYTEVLLWDQKMSATDRKKVETYLAIKYGITLDQTTAQNYVDGQNNIIWNATANAAYSNDIAGIGKDRCMDLDQRSSKSVNGDAIVSVSLNGGGAVAEGDYMVWGNNNGALATSADVPAGLPCSARLARFWSNAQTQNPVGAVDISFDLAAAGLPIRQESAYTLLIDTDGNTNFSSSTISAIAPSLVGTILTFANVTLNDGDRFTFAIDVVAPGGVNTNNTIWLKADAGVRNGGATQTMGTVDEWQDQSGNDLHIEQTNAAALPTVGTEETNYNPTLSLDGNDFLERTIPVSGLINSATGISDQSFGTVIAVSKSVGTGTLANHYDGVDNYIFSLQKETANTIGIGVRGNPIGAAPSPSQATITSAAFAPGANNLDLFVDGSLGTEATMASQNVSANDQDFAIGGTGYNNTGNFTGEIAEFITFDRKLTVPELSKVETYLAIKYGVSLGHNYFTSDYDGTNGATETIWQIGQGYDNDIAGIGREDCSGLDQRLSKSENENSALAIGNGTINAPSAIADNSSYMVWGHNGAVLSGGTCPVINIAGTDYNYMERVWKVEEFNNGIGNISIQYNLDELEAEDADFSWEGADLRLLVGDQADFSGTNNTYTGTLFNGIMTINNVPFSDGQFFTLITNEVPQLTITTANSSVTEGNAQTINFALDKASNCDVVVSLAYAPGAGDLAATAGVDYTQTATITIPAGDTSFNLSIATIEDSILELDETFTVSVTSVTNAVEVNAATSGQSVVITIEDDEVFEAFFVNTASATPSTPDDEDGLLAPTLQIGATITDQDGGAGTFGYEVSLFVTTDGSGSAQNNGGGAPVGQNDFSILGGAAITYAAGAVPTTFDYTGLTLIDDFLTEPDETIMLQLAATGSGGINLPVDAARDEHEVTINDDDLLTVVFNQATAIEVEGVNMMLPQITVSGAQVAANVAVTVTLNASTATEGSDFTLGSPLVVTIPPGNYTTAMDIAIPGFATIDDNFAELTENINLTLTSAVATVGTQNTTEYIITDNDAATLSIAENGDASEPATSSSFTISLQNGMGAAVNVETDLTITFALTGLAIQGDDYNAFLPATTTVTIPAGASSVDIPVIVIDDMEFEGTESVIATIQDPNGPNITLGTANDMLDILDNDNANVSIAAANDAMEDATPGTFTVSLSQVNNSGAAIVVPYTFANGTAIGGTDFNNTDGTVSIGIGQNSATISVPVLADALFEGTENYTISLTDPMIGGIALGTAMATGLILDNDSAVLSIAADQTGAEPSTAATFTVTLSAVNDTGSDLVFPLTISDISTNGATDYTAVANVTIANGASTATVTIPVVDDLIFETQETFSVAPQDIGVANLTISATNGQAAGMITDNDSANLQIAHTDATEDNTDGSFTFSLVNAGGMAVTTQNGILLNIAIDGTAANAATAGTDYATLPTTITIAAGTSTVTTAIDVTADTDIEGTETVTLNLTDPMLAGITVPVLQEEALILDNDNATLSIAQTTDGAEPSTPITFTIGLNAPNLTGAAIVVPITYTGGTATGGAGLDYENATTSVTIGIGETSATLTLAVNDDNVYEGTETVEVTITDPAANGVTLGTAVDTANITDNEMANISLTTISGSEPDLDATFFVRLTDSGANDLITQYPITFDLTYAGSATVVEDYLALPNTITIAAGASVVSQTIEVVDNLIFEPTETVDITVTPPVLANLGGGAQNISVNIDDDDSAILQIAHTDGAEDATNGSFTFSLENIVGAAVVTQNAITVNFTVDGASVNPATPGATAGAGNDYQNLPTSFTIPAGASEVAIPIVVFADAELEGTETVKIDLTDPVIANLTLGEQTETALIVDDESANLSVAATTDGEEDSTPATFTVALSEVNSTGAGIDVNYTFANGSATEGLDFTGTAGTVTIPNGASEVVVSVPVLADTNFESTEDFTITIEDPMITGINMGTATATGTIIDNDLVQADFSLLTSAQEPATPGTAEVVLSAVNETGIDIVFPITYFVISAEAGDYTQVATVTVPNGSATGVLSIPVVDDEDFELVEQIGITIQDPGVVGLTVMGSTVNMSILDDDSAFLQIAHTDASEENTNGSFTFSLEKMDGTARISQDVLTVNFTVDQSGANTATPGAGNDYNTLPVSFTIPAGASEVTIPIEVLGDMDLEGTEEVVIDIIDPSIDGFNLGENTETAFIIDDDSANLSVAAATDGMEDSTPVTFTVTLSQPNSTGGAIDVVYTFADGTAEGGLDFDATGGTVSIPDGQSTATISVPVLADALFEGTENFTVTIVDPMIAGVNQGIFTATGNILDNDDVTASVAATQNATEPATAVIFEVTLSAANNTGADIVINLTYADVTTNGATDFTETTSVTVPQGATTGTFEVAVEDDMVFEFQETFTVTLQDPMLANLTIDGANGMATGTIDDDDAAILQIAHTDAFEDATNGSFTFSLENAGGAAIVTQSALTVNFAVDGAVVNVAQAGATADGTNDYETLPTSFTIPAGASEVTIPINVFADANLEGTENVKIDLLDPLIANLTLASLTDTALILDDESANLSVAMATDGMEDNIPATFTITLSQPNSTGAAVDIDYIFADGTAEGGLDFDNTGGTVSILDGESTATITVPVLADALFEGTEDFTITIVDPMIAGINEGVFTATGNILDNDDVTASVAASQNGAEPATAAVFEVTLSAANNTGADIVINLTYADVSTNGATDFTETISVTVPQGATTATFEVAVVDDAIFEFQETFTVALQDPMLANLTIDGANGTATGTIDDDDSATLQITHVDAGEPATNGSFTFALVDGAGVALESQSDIVFSIDVDLLVAGAADPNAPSPDYTTLPTTITIAGGTSETTIPITVGDDMLLEGTELVKIDITDPMIANLGFASLTDSAQIIDDDGANVEISVTTEMAEPATDAVCTVTLSNANTTGAAIEILYTFSDGGATGGVDFNNTTGMVSIANGSTEGTFIIPVIDDLLYEGIENFEVTLTDPGITGITIVTGTATVNITDDDQAFLVLKPTEGQDGAEGGADVQFVLELQDADGMSINNLSGADVSVGVNFTQNLGTNPATAVDDYDNGVATFNLLANTSSATLTVAVVDDLDPELPEQVTINIIDPMAPQIILGATTEIFKNILDNDFFIDVVEDNETIDEDTSDNIFVVLDNDDTPAPGFDLTSIVVSTAANSGTTTVNADGTISYTPNADFFGNDFFVYTVCNQNIPPDCESDTVFVTVNNIADAPVAVTDNENINQTETGGMIFDLAGNDFDVDGDLDIASITILSGPSSGAPPVSVNPDGTITYIPIGTFTGQDIIVYQICDMTMPVPLCDSDTLFINVINDNGNPIAVDDNLILNGITDTVIEVLDNDSDPDGNTLTVTIIENPTLGTATVNTNNEIEYTTKATECASDSLLYEVSDPFGATDMAWVYIDILPPDTDGDGLYDALEGTVDVDGDGLANFEDDDSDGDGISDADEVGEVDFCNPELLDTDGDGILNVYDEDSDGDGKPDGEDGFEEDCDDNGINNWLDAGPCELIIPGQFTPNGDGVNDTFEIVGIAAFPSNEFQVFNRWGALVYKTNDYNNDWAGTCEWGLGGTVLPSGVYYYELKFSEGFDAKVGYVVIKR